MKAKKLPNKKIGDFVSQDEAAKRQGVKLVKQKRSKKPSIYDEMDDLEEQELELESEDYDDLDDFQDMDDEDDQY
jgi:hypothetical protein